CEVTTVTNAANADANIAGKCGPNAYSLDIGLLNKFHILLIDHPTSRNDDVPSTRMKDIVKRRTTPNTPADGSHDLTSIHDGLHGEAVFRAAMRDRDNAILRNVHQATGQVTGVSGLQSGICQTLTGTVGGVKVLHH